MKERGKVDAEAGKSMRAWEWIAVKTRDAVVCPKCKHLLFPGSKAGTFDFKVAKPDWENKAVSRLGVEVKYGESRFPFSLFDQEKRFWAEQIAEEQPDIGLWIWLGMGRSIKDKKYPRTTYLFPLNVFYKIEVYQLSQGRKSIPYNCLDLAPYELDWQGKGFWALRPDHPLAEET